LVVVVSEKLKSQQQLETLKGWKQTSELLGEPVSDEQAMTTKKV